MPLDLKFLPGIPPSFGKTLIDRMIPSDYTAKAKLVHDIMDTLRSHGFLENDDETLLTLCLDEALVNAIKHGNQEVRQKRVHVRLFAEDGRWGTAIEDEGEGFDPSQVPDPEDPESLLLDHGRGVFIIHQTMATEPGDAVEYYDRGNRLLMVRRRRSNHA
ncbi:MAG: ATP-binding protein, partial [Planctomycetes bacterium]|nr:ATP-binding protein [Planctomycetota bacterium]